MMADAPTPAPRPGLGIDIGSSKLVAATIALGGESAVVTQGSLPVIVRNNLSNDATPLAVTFGVGFNRELGEAAIDTPASNAHNLVSGFVPRLGAQGSDGACKIPAAEEGGDDKEIRLEQVLAMLLVGQVQNLYTQIGAAPSQLVLAVPPGAQPSATAAVCTAARIAGIDAVRVCHSTTALVYHYGERHGKDIAVGGVPQTVLIVDVGHLSCSAVIARYSPQVVAESADVDEEILIEILAQGGNFEAGGGIFDQVLSKHLKEKLEKEHGAEACGGAKFHFRLNKTCERLKKLLSTVDPAKMDVDSLIPDKDCRLSVTRNEWETMLAPSLAHLRSLITKILSDSGVESAALVAVEVVGGGARVPCVQDVIMTASSQTLLRHTLDSSAAVALGAAGVCKTFAVATPVAAPEEGEVKKKSKGMPPLKFVQDPWLEGGEGGMSEECVVEAIALEAQFKEREQTEREKGTARNALETFVYSMRAALEDKHKEHLDSADVGGTCERIENWLWDEGAVASAQQLVDKLEEESVAMKTKYEMFFEERHLAEKKRVQLEKEEEEKLAKMAEEEAANGEKDDHDNRILKFADRYALADKNKAEGTELFKGGNYQPAAQRYIKSLGHLSKLVHVESLMSEEDHAQAKNLKITCYNNLAMVFLKLQMWAKAIDNANRVVELDDQNCKALFRRAQARVQLKEMEEAIVDLDMCLALEPDDAGVVKLKAQAEKEVKVREEKAKKMYSKMFG